MQDWPAKGRHAQPRGPPPRVPPLVPYRPGTPSSLATALPRRTELLPFPGRRRADSGPRVPETLSLAKGLHGAQGPTLPSSLPWRASRSPPRPGRLPAQPRVETDRTWRRWIQPLQSRRPARPDSPRSRTANSRAISLKGTNQPPFDPRFSSLPPCSWSCGGGACMGRAWRFAGR